MPAHAGPRQFSGARSANHEWLHAGKMPSASSTIYFGRILFIFFLLQDSHTVAIGFFKLLTAFYSCPDTTPDCHGGTRLKNIKYPLKCCLMHVKHRLLETTSMGKLNNSTERFWFYLSDFKL